MAEVLQPTPIQPSGVRRWLELRLLFSITLCSWHRLLGGSAAQDSFAQLPPLGNLGALPLFLSLERALGLEVSQGREHCEMMELHPAGSPADASFCLFCPAVLCLHHDLPVHPPRFQHLLPVSTAEAVSASLLQDEAFPEHVCSSWLPRRHASTSTNPGEMRLLFHFIEGRIFVHWCHVIVVVGTFHIRVCGLHEGRPRVGSKPPPAPHPGPDPGERREEARQGPG